MENLIPTNSLIDASFDILDTENLINRQTLDLDMLTKVNMDESYFCSAVKFLTEINSSYTSSKIDLFKRMAVAESNTMLLESFTDYYVQIDSIVQKALKFLRDKIDEFINTMKSFISDNRVITEYKDDLLSFNSEINFTNKDINQFTIDSSIPNIRALDDFNASLFDDLFKPQVTDFNANDIHNAVTSTQLEEDYKKFRSHILGINDDNISEQEFARKLHMVYRNNNEFEIGDTPVKNMAEVWFNFNEYEKSLNEDYSVIENALNGILKKISVISKNNSGLSIGAFTSILPGDVGLEKIDGKEVDKSGMMMSSDMMLNLDIYCKAKVDQMHKYTDIVIMAMTSKMDAIKDMYMQYRACLYDAIQNIK